MKINKRLVDGKHQSLQTNKSESKVVTREIAPSSGKEMEKIKVIVDGREILK